MPMPSDDRVMAAIAGIAERFAVPGVTVGAVLGGETRIWTHGRRRMEHADPVTPATTFQLASCSKAYTAAAVAALVERNELGWDDPVRKHLPEFRLYDDRLSDLATLRDLLGMRVGLKPEGIMYWGRNAEIGTDVLLKRFRHFEPLCGFRDRFVYSNPNYVLLTEIVRRRTGKPFPAFLKEAILDPLELEDTFIQEGRLEPGPDHAFPHVVLDDEILPLGEARCGGRMGESCVYSSARDAVRWLRFQLGVQEKAGPLSANTLAELHRPQSLSFGPKLLDSNFVAYCMGWATRDTPHGRLIWHDGGEFGVATCTLMSPDHKAGIAVYGNVNKLSAMRALGHTLLDQLTGVPARDWAQIWGDMFAAERAANEKGVEAAMNSAEGEDLPREAILGSYYHPSHGAIELVEEKGALRIRALDGWVYDATLTPLGHGVYKGHCDYLGMESLTRRLNRVRFVRDAEGIALRTLGLGVIRKIMPA